MKFASAVLFLLGLTAMAGEAQTLADLARQQRNVRTEAPENERKITTEAATTPRPGASLSVAGTAAVAPAGEVEAAVETGEAEPAPTEDGDADTSQGTPADEAAATDAASPDTEDAWRERFADARDEITRTREQLALLELELGQLNAQLLTRSDIYNREYQILPLITTKEAEIREARQRLDDANQNIEQMREDLRRAGLPAGWGR